MQTLHLQYNGRTLAVWRTPEDYVPSFGTVLAVQYEGRYRLFRAMARHENTIFLDLCLPE